MKVVYKQRIHEKVFSAYTDALFEGRQIEHIELNDDEWYQFLNEIDNSYNWMDAYVNDNARVYGILVVHVR